MLPKITYHVQGKEILDNHGKVFIPYGVLVVGLSVPNWRHNLGIAHLTRDQMVAARNLWYANTVSLLVASQDLFAAYPYDKAYLAKIDQEVAWANEENMNLLLVLQYEDTTKQYLPTRDTAHFWDFMSRHYRQNPRVFFDVFNEPLSPTGIDDAAAWMLWRGGGTVNNTTYVGMQQLVDSIRGNHASNLLFVDGLATAEDIKGLPSHLLSGSNIVYAVHPYFNATQHATPGQWDFWFGNAARVISSPVVVDEWSEYQSATNLECFPQAPAVVPLFLNYIKERHMGLIAWALFPGLLIRGWNYGNPTAFDQPVYLCNALFPNYDPQAQGAGQLVRHFFKVNSSLPSGQQQYPF